ncbi:MAG: hypothetical protein AAF368_04010 [Planctomycetota bacterium]
MRAHLQGCAECKAAYVDAVQTAASVGGKVREEREGRDEEMRELRLEAAIAGRNDTLERAHRGRFFSLRLVLLPAFFFVLMMFVSRVVRGPERVRVVEWKGVTEAAGQTLENGGQAPRLIRGSWLRTGNGGSMVLELGGTRIGLEETSHLMVLATEESHFQLRSGRISIEGEAEVTTSLGVVEIDGRAEVSSRGSAFEVQCEDGKVTFVNAGGTTELVAGEHYRR